MGWAERAALTLAMLSLSCLACGFTAACWAGLVRRVDWCGFASAFGCWLVRQQATTIELARTRGIRLAN
jgi:hypothetical protein